MGDFFLAHFSLRFLAAQEDSTKSNPIKMLALFSSSIRALDQDLWRRTELGITRNPILKTLEIRLPLLRLSLRAAHNVSSPLPPLRHPRHHVSLSILPPQELLTRHVEPPAGGSLSGEAPNFFTARSRSVRGRSSRRGLCASPHGRCRHRPHPPRPRAGEVSRSAPRGGGRRT